VRRRFVLGLIGVTTIIALVAIARLGFEWKQALDDVALSTSGLARFMP
jgi:hypothetical protein